MRGALVEVKLSGVKGAGYGVFAARDIREDTCLGLYPGFAYERSFYERYMRDIMSHMPVAKRREQMRIRDKYSFENRVGNETIVLDPFPEEMILRYKETINGDVIDLDPDMLKAMLLIFMNEAEDQNVAYVPIGHHVAVMVIRAVSKGEELFSHYGYQYCRKNFGYNIVSVKKEYDKVLPVRMCKMDRMYHPTSAVYRCYEYM